MENLGLGIDVLRELSIFGYEDIILQLRGTAPDSEIEEWKLLNELRDDVLEPDISHHNDHQLLRPTPRHP